MEEKTKCSAHFLNSQLSVHQQPPSQQFPCLPAKSPPILPFLPILTSQQSPFLSMLSRQTKVKAYLV